MSYSIWNYGDAYDWMRMVQKSEMPPAIICIAPNGGVHGKESNPNLPETPGEIANDVYECYKAGASMVHFHARDPHNWGQGTGDPEQFYKINALIREKCPDIIINNTTGGSFGMSLEDRVAALSANPEVASLNMGPDMYRIRVRERKEPLPHPAPQQDLEGLIPVTYHELITFAKTMREKGIKPEMEVYNHMQWVPVNYMIRTGLLDKPYDIQLVMATGNSAYGTPENLINMIRYLPKDSRFCVASIGPFQLPMVAMSLLMGGSVRVGLEDNIFEKKGKLWESNLAAIKWVISLARQLNREIATPKQAREMMGLPQTPSKY